MLRCIIKLFLVLVCATALPQHVVAKDQPSIDLLQNSISNGNFGVEACLYSSNTPEYSAVPDCASPKNCSPQIGFERGLITSIWPTTWYIGLDLAKTCVGWYQKTGVAYEIHGSIDCSRILLNADYGWGQIQRDGRQHNGSFASAHGKYFRVGLDYNFLTPTLHHNQFFIGFRYARSFFDFQLKSNKLQCNHRSDDPCDREKCTPAPIALQHSSGAAVAHWWEVVAGGKVQLISILSIGCTARYKFNKKIEDKLYAFPFDIPGFGLAEFDHAFGYSLYILLRIPLQKSNKAYQEHFAQKSVT